MRDSDESLREAQLNFLHEMWEKHESMDAKNTLYFYRTSDDPQRSLDSGVVHLLSDSQLKMAVSRAVGQLGYAVVLDQLLHRLPFDAGDRGERGFAPTSVYKAGQKAEELLRQVSEILTKTPPTPY